MRQRSVLALVTLFCVILAPVGAAQEQKKPPLAIEQSWVAKILKASRPDSVTIRKPKEVEIPPPDERNESPPQDRQWLVLRVELTAPPKSILNTKDVRLAGDGPDLYLALARDWGQDTFVFFTEIPAGLAIGSGPEEVILLGRSPYTGHTKLTTESGWPSEVSFLFNIPATTEPLYLQIGKSVKVQVPLQ